jgi:hypothetical protein
MEKLLKPGKKGTAKKKPKRGAGKKVGRKKSR